MIKLYETLKEVPGTVVLNKYQVFLVIIYLKMIVKIIWVVCENVL